MSKINFIGYFDNRLISNGFLVPVYSDGENYFFHKLNKELNIQGYEPFEISEFTDSITKTEPKEVLNDLSYIVYKYDNFIYHENKTKIFNSISNSIFNKEIVSEVFIENFRDLFKHVLIKSLLECNSLISVNTRINKTKLDLNTKRYSSRVFELNKFNVHGAVKKVTALHINSLKETKLISQSKYMNEAIMNLSIQLSKSICSNPNKLRVREKRDITDDGIKKRRFEIERKY